MFSEPQMKRTIISLAAALAASSCLSDPDAGVFRPPELKLYAPAELGSTSAVFEYEVEWHGMDAVEACGLCWGVSPEPDLSLETVTSDKPGSGTHRTEISGLELGRTYRVRAYASGRRGTFYSKEQTFRTPVTFGSRALEEYLVSGYDADGDGYISLEEAADIGEILLPDAGVTSLGGIEYCTGLKRLDISGNPVTELALPQPSVLEELDCSGTGLQDLNEVFSQARTLRKLSARGMVKDGAKLYLLTRLESLDVSGSSLNSLEVGYNTALTALTVRNCNIPVLNLFHNTAISFLDCLGCPALKTINLLEGQEIDGVNRNTESGRLIPDGAEILYTAKIEDTAFQKFLCDNFDTDFDGIVSATEAAGVTEMKIDKARYSGISSLHGVEMFTSLKKLSAGGQNLSALDLSENRELSELACDNNPLKSLRVNECRKLERLYCQNTELESISLDACTGIEELYLFGSRLTALEINSLAALKTLDCQSNRLTGELDLSGCRALTQVNCKGNSGLARLILPEGSAARVTKDDTTEVIFQ